MGVYYTSYVMSSFFKVKLKLFYKLCIVIQFCIAKMTLAIGLLERISLKFKTVGIDI